MMSNEFKDIRFHDTPQGNYELHFKVHPSYSPILLFETMMATPGHKFSKKDEKQYVEALEKNIGYQYIEDVMDDIKMSYKTTPDKGNITKWRTGIYFFRYGHADSGVTIKGLSFPESEDAPVLSKLWLNADEIAMAEDIGAGMCANKNDVIQCYGYMLTSLAQHAREKQGLHPSSQ